MVGPCCKQAAVNGAQCETLLEPSEEAIELNADLIGKRRGTYDGMLVTLMLLGRRAFLAVSE